MRQNYKILVNAVIAEVGCSTNPSDLPTYQEFTNLRDVPLPD